MIDERTKDELRRLFEPETDDSKIDISIEYYVVDGNDVDLDPETTPEENGTLTRRLEGDSRNGLEETYRDDARFFEQLEDDDEISEPELEEIRRALEQDDAIGMQSSDDKPDAERS